VNPESLYKDFAEAWNKIPNIDRITADTGWVPKYDIDYIIREVAELREDYLLGRN
jgi:nucleoside-diphosphate-sugar epimerase